MDEVCTDFVDQVFQHALGDWQYYSAFIGGRDLRESIIGLSTDTLVEVFWEESGPLVQRYREILNLSTVLPVSH